MLHVTLTFWPPSESLSADKLLSLSYTTVQQCHNWFFKLFVNTPSGSGLWVGNHFKSSSLTTVVFIFNTEIIIRYFHACIHVQATLTTKLLHSPLNTSNHKLISFSVLSLISQWVSSLPELTIPVHKTGETANSRENVTNTPPHDIPPYRRLQTGHVIWCALIGSIIS